MPGVRLGAGSGAGETTGEAARHDYEALADSYETRWRAFNAAARGWILMRWPDLPPHARVLDVGCGAGGFLHAVAARQAELSLVGLDITPAMLARARQAVPGAWFVEGDAQDPPFAQDSFDVVCSLNVLHHLADPEAHIRALARLARPSGTIFLCTFAGGHNLAMRLSDRWLRMRNPSWRGMRTPQDIRKMVEAEHALSLLNQSEIKAGGWWWLQLCRLQVAEG